MNRPNFFKYSNANSSHAALLGFIFDSISSDESLNALGHDIVSFMTNKEVSKITSMDIIPNYKKINLLVNINDSHLLVIEDISYAKNPENSLKNHKDLIIESEQFKDLKKIFIYLDLSNEFLNKQFISANCLIITRSRILNFFKNYNMSNVIILNYADYLKNVDEETNLFKEIDTVNKWTWLTWEGFFLNLQNLKGIKNSSWEYVNNPHGLHIEFSFNSIDKVYTTTDNQDIPYKIFLQVEEGLSLDNSKNINTILPSVLFKVCVEENRYKSEIRNFVWEKIESLKKDFEHDNLIVEKTSHARGRIMTMGKIKNLSTVKDLEKAIEFSENLILILSNSLNDAN